MKADVTAGIPVVLTLILALIVATVVIGIFQGNTIEGGSYTPPKEKVECEGNSDCKIISGHGPICMSINDQPVFCGCSDDTDCGCDNCCKYNRCK
jgi:hypothetical protein